MKVFAWLALLCLWVVSPGAQAAGKAEDSKIEARKHFVEAEAHYKLGRFQKALQEYTRAYELAPLPGFLFNIGQCHRKLGNDERAMFFYRGYLRDKPKAKNRRLVLKLIRSAEQRLAVKRQDAERRKKEVERIQREKEQLAREQERLRDQQRQLALERNREQEAARLANHQPAPEVTLSEPALYEQWWFWAILGSAVAVATGGVIYAANLDDKVVLPSGNLGTLDLRR